jgi:hypothetical protein
MALSISRRGGEGVWLRWLLFEVARLALAALMLAGLGLALVWMMSRERIRPDAGESVTELELGGPSADGSRELLAGGGKGLSLDLGAAFGR